MRRETRISAKSFLIAAVVGVVSVTVIPAALGALSQNSTYSLSDFEIVYPYDDPREEVPPSEAEAAVSFAAHWPQSGFPGSSDCQVALTGTDGQQVGTLEFELLSATDGASPPPLVVPVSGEPIAAAGSCTAKPGEHSTAGAGYVFSGPTSISAATDVTGQRVPTLTNVEFDVRWEDPSTSPGMRTCYLVVSRSDGTEDPPTKYNMLVGQRPVTFDVQGGRETVTGAEVTCGPFEG